MHLLDALALTPTPDAPAVVAFVGGGGKSSAMFVLARELAAAGKRVVTTTTTRIAAAQIAEAPAFVPVLDTALPLDHVAARLDAHGHVMLIGRETVEHGAVYKRAGIAPDVIDALVAHSGQLGLDAVLVEADGSRMLPLKAPAAHEPVLPTSTTVLVPVAGMDAIGRPWDAAHVHRAEVARGLLGLAEDAHPGRVTPAQVAALLAHPTGGRKGQGAARVVALLNKVDRPLGLPLARLVAQRLPADGVPSLLGAMARPDAPIEERWLPWTAVILAAGASTRMGRPKQLLTVDGVPLVVRAVQTARQAGAPEVLVVTGAHAEAVAAAVADAQLSVPVRIVHNAAWEAGQASSVVTAINALRSPTQAALFLPVDQPFLTPLLLRKLVTAWQRGADLVAPTVDGTLRGAPCLFARRFWPELAALSGDVGGRGVLRRHAADAAAIVATGHELRDLDTPEQWTAFAPDVGPR